MKNTRQVRPLNDLKALCEERSWRLDSTGYENGEADIVVLFWTIGQKSGKAIIKVADGQFIGQTTTGEVYTHSDDDYTDCPWHQELLDAVFISAPTQEDWTYETPRIDGVYQTKFDAEDAETDIYHVRGGKFFKPTGELWIGFGGLWNRMGDLPTL